VSMPVSRRVCCFRATVALLIPSAVGEADLAGGAAFTQRLSVALAVLLLVTYGLGRLFSLKTHRELFAVAEHGEAGEAPLPIGVALGTLACVTVLVALVSEVFVESVQQAALAFGMTPAFVGFIVVALVGGAAEMGSSFSGARKNRLDLSVGIALGSASNRTVCSPGVGTAQLSPRSSTNGFAVLAGRGGNDADRNHGSSAGHQQWTIHLVRRCVRADGLSGLRNDPLFVAAPCALRGPEAFCHADLKDS